jgi:hypothetical protein
MALSSLGHTIHRTMNDGVGRGFIAIETSFSAMQKALWKHLHRFVSIFTERKCTTSELSF